MSYKPKFCCQCGDKIERINWNFYTSRRFCALCETDFKLTDLLPRIVVGCGILFGILGLGAYWQNSDPSVRTTSKQLIAASANLDKNSANRAATPQNSANRNVINLVQTPPNSSSTNSKPPIASSAMETKRLENSPDLQLVKIYYCGAQTKKGSPCSRKVKHPGRCWQHTGQPAMLAREKLIISQ